MNRSAETQSGQLHRWLGLIFVFLLVDVLTAFIGWLLLWNQSSDLFAWFYTIFPWFYVILVLAAVGGLVRWKKILPPRTFTFHWWLLWPLGLGVCWAISLMLLSDRRPPGGSRGARQIDLVLEVSPAVLFELSDREPGFTGEKIFNNNGLAATAKYVCRHIDAQVFGSIDQKESFSWRALVDWTMPPPPPPADVQPVTVNLHFAHGSDMLTNRADKDRRLTDILDATLTAKPEHLKQEFWSTRPLGFCKKTRDLLSSAESGRAIVVLTTADMLSVEQRRAFDASAAKAGSNLTIVLLPSLQRADGRGFYSMADKARGLVGEDSEATAPRPRTISLCRLDGFENASGNLTNTNVYSVPGDEEPLGSPSWAKPFDPEAKRKHCFAPSQFKLAELDPALDGIITANSQSTPAVAGVKNWASIAALGTYWLILFVVVMFIHADVRSLKRALPPFVLGWFALMLISAWGVLYSLVWYLWENPGWLINHFPAASTWVLMVTLLAIAVPPEVFPAEDWSASSSLAFAYKQKRFLIHFMILFFAPIHPLLGLVCNVHDPYWNLAALFLPVFAVILLLVVFTFLNTEQGNQGYSAEVAAVFVFGALAAFGVSLFFLVASPSPASREQQRQQTAGLVMIGILVVALFTMLRIGWSLYRKRQRRVSQA